MARSSTYPGVELSVLLSKIRPNAVSLRDYVLVDRGDGPCIDEWMSQDKCPTDSEIKSAIATYGAVPVRTWRVPTATIVDRLISAGLFEAADAALGANPSQKARFYTRGYIHSNNDEARSFLSAIGADPDAILAPE